MNFPDSRRLEWLPSWTTRAQRLYTEEFRRRMNEIPTAITDASQPPTEHTPASQLPTMNSHIHQRSSLPDFSRYYSRMVFNPFESPLRFLENTRTEYIRLYGSYPDRSNNRSSQPPTEHTPVSHLPTMNSHIHQRSSLPDLSRYYSRMVFNPFDTPFSFLENTRTEYIRLYGSYPDRSNNRSSQEYFMPFGSGSLNTSFHAHAGSTVENASQRYCTMCLQGHSRLFWRQEQEECRRTCDQFLGTCPCLTLKTSRILQLIEYLPTIQRIYDYGDLNHTSAGMKILPGPEIKLPYLNVYHQCSTEGHPHVGVQTEGLFYLKDGELYQAVRHCIKLKSTSLPAAMVPPAIENGIKSMCWRKHDGASASNEFGSELSSELMASWAEWLSDFTLWLGEPKYRGTRVAWGLKGKDVPLEGLREFEVYFSRALGNGNKRQSLLEFDEVAFREIGSDEISSWGLLDRYRGREDLRFHVIAIEKAFDYHASLEKSETQSLSQRSRRKRVSWHPSVV